MHLLAVGWALLLFVEPFVSLISQAKKTLRYRMYSPPVLSRTYICIRTCWVPPSRKRKPNKTAASSMLLPYWNPTHKFVLSCVASTSSVISSPPMPVELLHTRAPHTHKHFPACADKICKKCTAPRGWAGPFSLASLNNQQQTSMAKRKLRGSPARGGGSSPMSPMQARLARGFPPSGGGVRLSEHQQAKRAAASFGASSSSPSTSCCITSRTSATEQSPRPSFSEGEAPPQPQPPAQTSREEDAAGLSGMSISGGEGGEAEQEDGPPDLASLGSAPAPPSSASGGAAKRQQLQQLKEQQPKKKNVDIEDMMLKAKIAADNIRLLLHAKVRHRKIYTTQHTIYIHPHERPTCYITTKTNIKKTWNLVRFWGRRTMDPTGSLCRFHPLLFFSSPKRGRDDVIRQW